MAGAARRVVGWLIGHRPWGRRTPSSTAVLSIGSKLWEELTKQLECRGHNERESGAFLLARRTTGRTSLPATVTHVAYYDDLDGECLTGGISLAGSAYDTLWEICRQEELRVIADVHTHPGSWVGQSSIDARHPMMANAGHVALIVPDYSSTPVDAGTVGTHLFLGSGAWKRVTDGLVVVAPDKPGLATMVQAFLRHVRTLTRTSEEP